MAAFCRVKGINCLGGRTNHRCSNCGTWICTGCSQKIIRQLLWADKRRMTRNVRLCSICIPSLIQAPKLTDNPWWRN